jgi:hypothetical protein
MFEPQKPKQPSEDAIIVENVSKRFRIPYEKKTKFFDRVEGEGVVEYIIDSLPLLNGTYLFTAAVYDFACAFPCRWKYGKASKF